MVAKRSRKRPTKKVKSLRTKSLTAKQAKGVKGGGLGTAGKHIETATLNWKE